MTWMFLKTTAMRCVRRNIASEVWRLTVFPLMWEYHGRRLLHYCFGVFLDQTGENPYSSLTNKDRGLESMNLLLQLHLPASRVHASVKLWTAEKTHRCNSLTPWMFDYVSSPVPQQCCKINPKAKPLVLVVLQLDQSERRIWLSGSFLASVF